MAEPAQDIKPYNMLPTIRRFHLSPAQVRCIVGPVGSGKTSAAAMEVCYYLPHFCLEHHNIKKTRWVVVRNSYRELEDTTRKTIIDAEEGWFPDGRLRAGANEYYLTYENKIEVELLFRSCDRPEDLKKFKSLEITGYWIDESIEVAEDIKRMLKTRIGRYPRLCPVRFGIETTNPPDVEHLTYSQFAWDTPPPGPVPEGTPLENHVGFWQPPRENEANLRPHYYDQLITDYADSPDWAEMYVQGNPGILIKGKMVYNNFKRNYHVADKSLVWAGGKLYRGWDNSGNVPAAVVLQVPSPLHIQVLKEYHSDRMGIVDFTKYVVNQCALDFSNAEFEDWADPAGEAEFSTKKGGLTSNAKLMRDECNVNPLPSDNNLTARIQAVDQALARIDGILIDPACIRLINGFMGGYCYTEIGTSGIHRDKPEKNRFSHVHDGLQYVVMKLTMNTGKGLSGFQPKR